MRIARFISPLLKITFFAAMFLPLLILPVAAQTAVGYVQEVRGNWYLVGNPSQKLRQGQKLFAASVVKRQSSSPDDRISVVNLRGEIIDSRQCGEPKKCLISITLPNSGTQRGYLSEAYNTIMNWIFSSPTKYSVHRSRSENLFDGIVKLENETVNFGSILKTPGKYHLRWRAIAASEKMEVGDWLETIEIDSIEKQPALVSTAKLKPGLYEVNVLRKRGKNLEPMPDYIWILVSAPANYEKNVASFQEAIGITKKWNGQVTDSAVSIFLRAALDNLARQNVTPNK